MTEFINSSSVGSQLRAAREACGWSVGQVAERLKLKNRQIEAIEQSRYAELPGPTFVRGFVRNYARLLNLDCDRVLQQLQGELPAEVPPPERETLSHNVVPDRRRHKPWLPFLMGGAVVLALIIGVGYETHHVLVINTATLHPDNGLLLEPPQPSVTASAATTTASTPVATASAPAAASTQAAVLAQKHPPPPPANHPASAAQAQQVSAGPLQINTRLASWVSVTDQHRHLLYQGLSQAGNVVSLPGSGPFHVKIGKAIGVEVHFHGRSVDLKPYTHGSVATLILADANNDRH